MQQKLIVWYKGHSTTTIDLEAKGAVEEATRIFEEQRRAGFLPVRTEPGPLEALTSYDPLAQTIEFVVPIAGG